MTGSWDWGRKGRRDGRGETRNGDRVEEMGRRDMEERQGGETRKRETTRKGGGRREKKGGNEDLADMQQQGMKQTGSMLAYILTAEIYSYTWQINVHSERQHAEDMHAQWLNNDEKACSKKDAVFV
jgi:hypothetical protein